MKNFDRKGYMKEYNKNYYRNHKKKPKITVAMRLFGVRYSELTEEQKKLYHKISYLKYKEKENENRN